MKKKYSMAAIMAGICILSAGTVVAAENITASAINSSAQISGYNNPYANAKITPGQAKKIALARVPGATEANVVRLHLDYDDGYLVYEGKIYFKNVEYEFDIDANTGDIVKWESESGQIWD